MTPSCTLAMHILAVQLFSDLCLLGLVLRKHLHLLHSPQIMETQKSYKLQIPEEKHFFVHNIYGEIIDVK